MFMKTKQTCFCEKWQQKKHSPIGKALTSFKFYRGLYQLVIGGFTPGFEIVRSYAKYPGNKDVKFVPFIGLTKRLFIIMGINEVTIFF